MLLFLNTHLRFNRLGAAGVIFNSNASILTQSIISIDALIVLLFELAHICSTGVRNLKNKNSRRTKSEEQNKKKLEISSKNFLVAKITKINFNIFAFFSCNFSL